MTAKKMMTGIFIFLIFFVNPDENINNPGVKFGSFFYFDPEEVWCLPSWRFFYSF